MEVVKRLKDEDFKQFVEIVANAYPGMVLLSSEDKQKMEERILKTQKEDDDVNFYGLFRDGQLLGGMRIHNFNMRLRSAKVRTGGIGMVAVDFMHKKEKAAKGIVTYFLRHCRNNGMPMAALYPFRPDFYKKMGFGFGTKMNQYSVRPWQLPKGSTKAHVAFLQEQDKQLLLDCYSRIAESTNGMMDRSETELDNMLSVVQNKLVVYKSNGRIEGYIIFAFKKVREDNILKNNMFIREFLYENNTALMELMTFLNSQEDQIDRIIINTQDEDFHHMLYDPRDASDNLMTPVYHESNLQGVGIMYRITDTKALFEAMCDHDFNGVSCRLRMNVRDNLLEENNGAVTVHFNNGIASLAAEEDYEAEINIDIADFSSLIMGSVTFKSLLRYGIVEISDRRKAETVNKLFQADQKPVCLTMF